MLVELLVSLCAIGLFFAEWMPQNSSPRIAGERLGLCPKFVAR